MSFPENLRYTKTHEWAKQDGKRIRVGITDYAQKEISDVVFAELPKLNQEVEQGKPMAIVESVKAAFDIYAPVSGKVVAVNKGIEANPALINQDCYQQGWLAEIEANKESEWQQLMTTAAYEQHIQQSVK
ncbi:MAG: glycine cleavage system protein GcvH [Candidatus Omnitrophica bacterium]|nr:glycine cleavage system protein GcvH [Candidatus Omnitrophota bacterium]